VAYLEGLPALCASTAVSFPSLNAPAAVIVTHAHTHTNTHKHTHTHTQMKVVDPTTGRSVTVMAQRMSGPPGASAPPPGVRIPPALPQQQMMYGGAPQSQQLALQVN
jgi:hypothetical protein